MFGVFVIDYGSTNDCSFKTTNEGLPSNVSIKRN